MKLAITNTLRVNLVVAGVMFANLYSTLYEKRGAYLYM